MAMAALAPDDQALHASQYHVLELWQKSYGGELLILALGHGTRFAGQAANATLLGLVSLAAFAPAYGRVARRRDWRASLIAGWAAAAVAALHGFRCDLLR